MNAILHPYRLNADQVPFVAAASQIATTVSAEYATEVDKLGRFPTESLTALAKGRFWGLLLPQTVGGSGQSLRTFAAVVEELAQHCASSAMIYVMHVSAAQVLAASETIAAKDDLLRSIASGQHLTTLAFSEAGSRSHFWAPMSEFRSTASEHTVSAHKSWVTSANHADSYVSSSRKPGASSPMESTLYLVERTSPGVHIAGPFDGLGLRGNDSSPVKLDNVVIADGALLTRQGEGAGAMLGIVLPTFVIGTAAMAHGIALSAIAHTRTHLIHTEFQHTGERLRDLPTLRARFADMVLHTERSRNLLGFALDAIEKTPDTAMLHVLQARASSQDTALAVTDLGMQATGGAAFSKHLPMERHLRDARAGWIMAPTMDQTRDFIGKAMLDLPLF